MIGKMRCGCTGKLISKNRPEEAKENMCERDYQNYVFNDFTFYNEENVKKGRLKEILNSREYNSFEELEEYLIKTYETFYPQYSAEFKLGEIFGERRLEIKKEKEDIENYSVFENFKDFEKPFFFGNIYGDANYKYTVELMFIKPV